MKETEEERRRLEGRGNEGRVGGRKEKKKIPNFISKHVFFFVEPTTERYMIQTGRHTKTEIRHRPCLTTNVQLRWTDVSNITRSVQH